MKFLFVSFLFIGTAAAAATPPQWEEAPFMDTPPISIDGNDFFANHCVAFTVQNVTVLNTGILRIPEFDVGCGEGCATREDFSDFYGRSIIYMFSLVERILQS